MVNSPKRLRPFSMWPISLWVSRQQTPPQGSATLSQILVIEGEHAVVLYWDAGPRGGKWRDERGQERGGWTLWQPVVLPHKEVPHG
jgi:hypothetical protein